MGHWLREYSGAFSAGATVVLVIVTGVYVHIMSIMSRNESVQIREMIKSRLDAHMPVVAISVEVRHEPGSSSVEIRSEVENIGGLPSDLTVEFPESWTCDRHPRGESDPGVFYATVNPGKTFVSTFNAEVDPHLEVRTRPPYVHFQNLSLEFYVSPQSGGVQDLFTWGTSYNASVDQVEEHTHYGMHDRRQYIELERMERKDSIPKRRLGSGLLRTFSRLSKRLD